MDSTFQCSPIYMQGKELLRLPRGVYSVAIGEESCQITDVTSNLLICKPPESEPHDTALKVLTFVITLVSSTSPVSMITFASQ